MQTLIIFAGIASIVVVCSWITWRIYTHPPYVDFRAWLWALAGNSRTLAVAYVSELLAMLDEAKIIEWSSLIGSERAGRVLAVMGIVMIMLRLITKTAVSWRVE